MNAGRERLPRREKTRSEDAGFALDTAANALGTLIAAAVIYLVGVIAGVFTFQLFVAVLAPAGGSRHRAWPYPRGGGYRSCTCRGRGSVNSSVSATSASPPTPTRTSSLTRPSLTTGGF